MIERFRLTIYLKYVSILMMLAYHGKLIPGAGRPEHFEVADLECDEGFAGPPPGWSPDVQKNFKIEED